MIDCTKCSHYYVCREVRDGYATKTSCDYYEEERPHGEWIPLKNKKGEIVAFRCSSCGQNPKYAVNSDFCPKCGADMRKAGDQS